MTGFTPQSLTGETVEFHEVRLAFALALALALAVVAWRPCQGRDEKGDEILNPFLVLRLPTREPRSDTREGGGVPHKTPEERRRPVPFIWCALSRNEAESQQGGHGRAQDRGIRPGITGLRHFSLAATKRFQKSSPCPFPSPSPLTTA
jgi:hypothetical protein